MTREQQLLRDFEIVNGITSEWFDEKDWIKFERFCERQHQEGMTGFDILEGQGIDPRDFESDLY